MSNGEVRKVSLQDIQLVQNLIERCLQLYMSQREVVSTLFHQAKIEPGFTELVWQKLEAENQEFFRAYHLRLIVKDQILRFNQLLERQVELMRQMSQRGFVSTPLPKGSQTNSMRNKVYQCLKPAVPYIKSENMHQMISALPNVYTNGTSSQQPQMQVSVDMVGLAGRVDLLADMPLAQSSNVGIMQGFHGRAIKTEGDYAGETATLFGADSNLLQPHNVIREASISHFSGGECGSQTFNETVLEPETNSFGHLGQMTQNFNFSDLTADFSNSIDMLESYSRSPFLERDSSFLDPHIWEGEQDIKRSDAQSDGFSYEGFSSE